MDPDAALAACRFVHDTAVLLLWGAFAYLAFLVPPTLGRAVQERLDGFRRGAVLAAVATTAASLPIEVAAIGNGWADVGDLPTARAVLFETSVGTALMVQGGLALLLAATLLAPAPGRLVATACASGLLLASLALTGHAAMDEGLLGIAHRLNDGLHLLAAGGWLGALVPLLAVTKALGDPSLRGEAGVALRRFSTAGHGAVALVIASGAANTALVLKRWPTDWSSPYQALLTVKIGLVLLMTGLAVANRYALVPRIKVDRERSIALLRAGTLVEIALGVLAVACVSVFGLLEPN